MKRRPQSIKDKSITELLGERKLVLASGSPRRAQILKRKKVEFEIRRPAHTSEESLSSDPVEHVLSVSRKKATGVSDQLEDVVVLGADTIVVLDGVIMGKPQDKKEAFSILKRLSGRTHKVYTGVTLINKYNGKTVSDYDVTDVKFNKLEGEKILAYIETGEPTDKAGAYGIQGMGGFLVEGIRGSLDNVIGLPTEKLKEMLIRII
jgi:septum formation protein